MAQLGSSAVSDIDGETAQDLSGCAVSLSSDGNTLAIGAQQNSGRGGSKSGHTRIYDWDGSTWVQRGSDINGESGGDQSGLSVSLSTDGNVVAIGGKFNDGNRQRLRPHPHLRLGWHGLGQAR
ncbi:MAG: hypothetical protein CM15mP38_3480 [Synechococcus sp.]|nr:MAG: hypothetical protein CM15mP38_3480 [Synechococcus sp.]